MQIHDDGHSGQPTAKYYDHAFDAELFGMSLLIIKRKMAHGASKQSQLVGPSGWVSSLFLILIIIN